MKQLTAVFLIFTNFVGAATFDVSITNFRFTPNDLAISVGDTVRWTNNQGFHDVTEDNNLFSSGAASSSQFVFEHTFNTVEEVLYYCTVHSQPGMNINTNMNGKITVEEVAVEVFKINQGISGAWFFPDTSGSGFLFDIRPSDQFIFVAWFTYDVENPNPMKIGSQDNRWFTASGNYVDDSAINIPIFHTFGGLFDNDQDVTTEQIGTMTFVFDTCNSGNVIYNITEGSLSGTFPIQRVIPGTESLCESIDNEP